MHKKAILLILFWGLLDIVFLYRPAPALPQGRFQQTSASAEDTVGSAPAATQTGLEGPVKYWADTIDFSMDRRLSFLRGNVKIVYQNITLTAGKVTIDWKRSYMVATGVADSTDSLGNPVFRDNPVLTEKGNEPIRGVRLEYDFKNQRGKVLEGRTKMEPGFYAGKEIKKVGKETLFIRSGCFTTCDKKHPHFYFCSSRMRVRVNKVAVAEPIVMYIADVPVFAVPFGVFPLQRGRRSGFIMPTYGENNIGGRYLEKFGFYWAASDYWDTTLLANFYEKTGIVYSGQLRYKKRYAFEGNISGNFAPRDVTTGEKRQRWNVNFQHRQNIGQTITLNANGAFQSDKTFLRQYSNDINQRLNQDLRTEVVMTKKWPASGNSLRMSMFRIENLQNGKVDLEFPRLLFSQRSGRTLSFTSKRSRDPQQGRVDFTLPDISFRQPQRNLFGYPSRGRKASWYHNITYNYNTRYLSRGFEIHQGDSVNQRQVKTGWNHNVNMQFQNKLLSYLNVSQFVNLQELWVPEYLQYTWVDSLNDAVPDTVKRFRARHTFNMGISLKTTIYGLWEIPFLPVKIIRHKMDPLISFNYTPDFSAPGYGYVQTFRDSTGQSIKKDRFSGNLFGGTPLNQAQSMNISLKNLFQGKVFKNGEEKKIDLFRLDFSSRYNFLADSLKWGDIGSNLQASAHRDFNFSLTATHTLYKARRRGTGKRNELVWENNPFALPRLLNLQISASAHLAPPKKKAVTPDTSAPAVPQTAFQTDITQDPVVQELRGFTLPWDLNLQLTYSYNRSDIRNPVQRFDVTVNGRFELTKNWRVRYDARLDLINKNIDYQSFSIYRDLHCWEMSFSWQPNSAFSSFRLEIRIKESALRDIKLTKTSRGRTVL